MTDHAPHDESDAAVALAAIKERIEWRRTMGGRSPGVHPTLLAMEQDIDTLVAEVERLRATTKEREQ